ncbi:MAG TPA: hypothetical protein VLH83_02640 [Chthoniobacterales bacterium]|nr:hypothetical protein [Chthoniobacterales bacterium]
MTQRMAPYPGLRPFGENDRAIFFGREAQTVSVLALLEENQFVAVVGSSGSGKSSLVLAGVLPAVREGFLRSTSDWKIVVLKPGSDPCGNLARALEREGVENNEIVSTPVVSPAGLVARTEGSFGEDQPRTLIEKLHVADRALIDLVTPARGATALKENRESIIARATETIPSEELSGPRLLIVVDQFEEIFTFRRAESETGAKSTRFAPRDEAATFVRLLLTAAADQAGRIAVVITMRSDFIGDCDAFLELPELVSQCQFLVPRLNRSQMREAIERPGQIDDLGYAPFGFEAGLVNRIIAEAGDRLDQLPLMQHALMRIWKEAGGPTAVPERGLILSHRDYEKAGMIAHALSDDADLAWKKVKDDPGKARLTRQLFLLLSDVHPDGKIVRRRPLVSEIQTVTGADIAAIEEIVRLFQSEDRNFLVPPLTEGARLEPDDHLDISHEALLRQWTEFGKWLAQETESKTWLQDLSRAATDLDEDPKTERWHGNDLRGAEEWMRDERPSEAWARRHGVTNWDRCLAFLELSRAEAKELQEKQRRAADQAQREKEQHQKSVLFLSRILGATFLLFLVVAILLLIRARRSENSARASESRAKEAIDLFATTADDVAAPIKSYAASALSQAEQQVAKLTKALSRAGTESPPDKAAVDELIRARTDAEKAADAIEKLAGSLKKAVEIRQDDNLKRTAESLSAEAEKVRARRKSLQRNSEALAALKESIGARIEHMEEELAGILGVEKPDRALVLSKDENIVEATADLDAILAIGLAGEALGFKEADFSEFKDRAEKISSTLDRAHEIKEAAYTTSDIAVWKKDIAVEIKHQAKINRVHFSPKFLSNNPCLVSAGEDKAVRFWDKDGTSLAVRAISSSINDIAFNPQGTALAAASNGSTVRVFSWGQGLTSSTIAEVYFEKHSDSITDVEYSHAGDRIVSASADRTVRVFDSHTLAQAYFTSPALPSIVTSVAFHPRDMLVVSGSDDGQVRLHSIDPPVVLKLGAFGAPARRPEFSIDGQFVIAASGDKTARVWTLPTVVNYEGIISVTAPAKEIVNIEHPAPVTHATFRPGITAKGYSFATTATNGEVRLVQFAKITGSAEAAQTRILERRHPGAAVFATWSSDGHWLATVGGGEIILWEWINESCAARLRLAELPAGTSRAEFSPDGHFLVAYGGDQSAYVWDLTKPMIPGPK